MTARRLRILVILTLLLLAIVIGSFMPFEAKQWLGTPYHHHAFHFIVFLVSAFVMMWLVRRPRYQILITLTALALALFVEAGEVVLFRSQMEWQDVADDCGGIAVAAAATRLQAARKRTASPAASEK